ncbi:DinB family protein [Thermaerobacter litoralis]
MSSVRPSLALLRVQDLDRSVRFYRQLGFRICTYDPEAGVAVVDPVDGHPFTLALPGVDATPWLHEVFEELAEGRQLYLGAPGGNLEAFVHRLRDQGLPVPPPEQAPDGSLVLGLQDPDGHRLSFWQGPEWTDEELLVIYTSAPDRLSQALAGLTGDQLDLARAPGKWTIRQIVHHIADSDASSLIRILMCLAEPGRPYNNNPYDQDIWVERLDHAHRPIEPSLALIASIRHHVAALVRHRPEALDGAVEPTLGAPMTARELIAMLASHALHHIAQIAETRRVHGLG